MATGFFDRMMRAAKLDSAVYEEVEADSSATGQAALVVILASIAAGIGALLYGGIGVLILATIGALIGWIVWAALVYVIGAKLLPESQTEADIGQLMRTIGFSSSPGIIRILGIIPAIGPIIVWLANVWMLVAMVIAVRQALDYQSTWRAVGVCVIGWIIQIIIYSLFLGAVGPGGAGAPSPVT